jgi:hypothetical protein
MILKLCNEFITDIEVKYDDVNNIYYNLFNPELTYTEDELNIEDDTDEKNEVVDLIKLQNKQINKVINYLLYYSEKDEEVDENVDENVDEELKKQRDENLLAIKTHPQIISLLVLNQTDNAVGFYDATICPYVYNVSIYDHLIGFRRSNNIAYYVVKPIIYKIFKNLLRNTNIELVDIQKTAYNPKDYLYFIELIYGLYICFNIFDMLDLTYHDLQNLYSDASLYIVFDKKEYSSQLNTLFDKTATIGDYILTATQRDKYKKDIQNEQYFKLALSVLHLDIKLGEIREKNAFISRPNKKTSPIYRFQQIAYYNNYLKADIPKKLKEEHNIILPPSLITHISSLDANSTDDAIFWLNNNNITHTLARNAYVKHSCFPKILAYNPITFQGTEDNPVYPHNNNANTNYLHYGINLCCNNAEELCNELLETDNKIMSNININIINYDEHNLTQSGDLPDKKEVKQKEKLLKKDEKTKAKEAEKIKKEAEKEADKIKKGAEKEADKIKKEAEKESKKQENALKRKEKSNEREKCDKCDVFYTLKNKSSHKCK